MKVASFRNIKLTAVQLVFLLCLFHISVSRAGRRSSSFDQSANRNKRLDNSRQPPPRKPVNNPPPPAPMPVNPPPPPRTPINRPPPPAPIPINPPLPPPAPVRPIVNPPTVAPAASNVFNLQLPNWCDTKPCLNLGQCTTTTATYLCVCAAGFYGDRCEFDAIQCVNSPCLNNGLCIKSSTSTNGYSCQCLAGFVGTICESQAAQLPAPSAVQPDSSWLVDSLAAGVAVPLFTPTPPASYVDLVGGYLGFTIIICGIIIITAFVCTVETERKFLVDQYKMITEVGYQADFPNIDFFTVAGRRVRNGARTLCCCSKGMEDVKVPLLGSRIPLPAAAPTAAMSMVPLR